MQTEELRYWETPEYREKYSDADRKALAKKGIGHAMPDGSYPTDDAEDVEKAVHAVGRGGADHDAIRKHIIAAAKRLNCMDLIPDNWNSDGSIKQANAALTKAAERRKKARHRAVPLGREVRFFAPESLEVRREARDDTDIITITGDPIVYGAAYSVVDHFGEFRETIHAGSVDDLLTDGVDCRYLFNHDGLPMARTKSGTMSLRDSSASLKFEARLDARQQLANDLAIAIERGDVEQMSVGMIVGRDKWGDDSGTETRDIFALNDLLDVSAVTYPCSPTTHIEVAQRMAMAMPLESRARLRKMEVELRAGKVLSADSQSKLVAALTALHDLASAGGVDPGALGPNSDEDDDVLQSHSDGTEGGSAGVEADASIVYPDGSGQRGDDAEDVEHREEESSTMKASTLRLLNEAGRKTA